MEKAFKLLGVMPDLQASVAHDQIGTRIPWSYRKFIELRKVGYGERLHTVSVDGFLRRCSRSLRK